MLTHYGLMMPCDVREPCHYCFMQWLSILFVNRTTRSKLQRHFTKTTRLFINETAFENVFWKKYCPGLNVLTRNFPRVDILTYKVVKHEERWINTCCLNNVYNPNPTYTSYINVHLPEQKVTDTEKYLAARKYSHPVWRNYLSTQVLVLNNMDCLSHIVTLETLQHKDNQIHMHKLMVISFMLLSDLLLLVVHRCSFLQPTSPGIVSPGSDQS